MHRRLRVVLLSAVALLATTLVPAPAAQAKVTLKKSMWGPVERAGKSQFPIYKQLGVGLFQTAMRWDAVAPTQPASPRDPTDPAYQWPAEVDLAIAEGKRHGIQVSIMLIGAPGWANGGRDSRWAPTNPQLFADFAEAAARRYPAVRHWMIWSEPTKASNFQPLSKVLVSPVRGKAKVGIQRYARLLDASYVRLKSVSRRNLVIGGNSFTTGTVSPRRYIEGLRLPNGKPPRMDLYGHNPFSMRKPALDQPSMTSGYADFADLDTLSRWVDRNLRKPGGGKLKLFLSEISIPTDHPNFEFNYFFTRKAQAAWIRDALRIVRRWDRIYTFGYLGLYDDAKRPDNLQVERGLITRQGARKPAFSVFRRG